jgi:RNA polymerase sigma-70 factor (ECF subfamily)
MVDLDDEKASIAKSQQGDHEAFESLIKRYQHMIHSLTFRMTGSLADSEDLAQETFIQAFQQLVTFRHQSKFSSWLYRVALNACLNWNKRARRRDQAHQEWGEHLALEPTDSNQPDALTQAVQEALLDLKPAQRAAVVLTVYDGLSHAEAARILECSETTVSWRVFAARRKLKHRLRPLVDGQERTPGENL